MARTYFSYSVVRSDPSNLTTGGDAILTSLKDVTWSVKKIDESGNEQTTAIYTGSNEGASSISGAGGTTDWNGLIEFWANPGQYVINIIDPKARVATKKLYWDSVSGQTGGIPGDNITSETITTTQIGNAQVKTEDIDSSAVTTAKLASNSVTTAKIAASGVTYEKLNTDVITAMPPIGSLMDYSGSGDPVSDQWILCDGRQLSQSVYSDLYAVVATRYNTGGESAGNFRIPDFRGRASAAPENMGTNQGAPSTTRLTNNNTLGASAGSSSVSFTLSTANIPAHYHSFSGSASVSGTTDGGGGHDHGVTGQGSSGVWIAQGSNNLAGGSTLYGFSRGGLGTDWEPDHTHTFNASGSASGNTGWWGGNTAGQQGTTSAVSLDTRQPYLVVNKIIRVK